MTITLDDGQLITSNTKTSSFKIYYKLVFVALSYARQVLTLSFPQFTVLG